MLGYTELSLAQTAEQMSSSNSRRLWLLVLLRLPGQLSQKTVFTSELQWTMGRSVGCNRASRHSEPPPCLVPVGGWRGKREFRLHQFGVGAQWPQQGLLKGWSSPALGRVEGGEAPVGAAVDFP